MTGERCSIAEHLSIDNVRLELMSHRRECGPRRGTRHAGGLSVPLVAVQLITALTSGNAVIETILQSSSNSNRSVDAKSGTPSS